MQFVNVNNLAAFLSKFQAKCGPFVCQVLVSFSSCVSYFLF
jgi:hypothetical protein